MASVMDLGSNETFEQKRDRLLLAWKAAKEALDTHKDAEMNLRKAVCAHLFPQPVEGTQRFDLGNGYSVKLTYKNNYNIERDADKVDVALEIMAKMGNEGGAIAERIVKWKADLSITEYRQLVDRSEKFKNDPTSFGAYATEARILRELNNILTITPGSPTLEIEEPKQGSKR